MPQSFLMAKNGSSRTRLFEGLNVDGSNVTSSLVVVTTPSDDAAGHNSETFLRHRFQISISSATCHKIYIYILNSK